jgi:hypothetical protein
LVWQLVDFFFTLEKENNKLKRILSLEQKKPWFVRALSLDIN